MDAILKLYNPGDEILSTNDLYGGSYRLITKVFEQFGLKGKFVDMSTPEDLLREISPNTKLLWIETPTNPMLSIVDIQKVTELAHKKGIKVCVDNTFAVSYTHLTLPTIA